MAVELFVFFVGLLILYVGAEGLVRGASAIAHRYGIRSFVVGATVVAVGTSMPEFVVNVIAVYTGEGDIALGNIVGSNVANTGLILGACALLAPLGFARRTLRLEYPMMMAALIVFYLLVRDGAATRLDGAILFAGLIGFFTFSIRTARSGTDENDAEEALIETPPSTPVRHKGRFGRYRRVIYVVAGIILLAIGARLMVGAAINIAEMFGIQPIVIGLTVVAIGTSLPEVATSVVSVLREQTDILIGNVLGSNLMNIVFVVGTLSLITPLSVEPSAIALHIPVMLAINIVLLPIAWTGRRVSRFEGALLLAGFVGYTVYLVLPYV